MKDKKIKIGVIGAGYMGSVHAGILYENKSCILTGICGRTKTHSEKIANNLQIKCYNDSEELINDPGMDVVDICTPTDSHTELAVRAMKAGKHVIIEFPLCRNTDELDLLIKTSKTTGKICSAAYYSRFQSQLSFIFNEVKTGRIGDITGIHISRRSPDYFASEDICNNLISQDIDYVVGLIGSPKDIIHHNLKQDQAVFIFDYKDKTAIIEGATNMHPGFPFSIFLDIAGSKGSIKMNWRFTDRPEYTVEMISKEGIQTLEVEDYDPYQYEMEMILAGLVKNTFDPRCSLESIKDGANLTFRCRDLIS